MEPEFHEEIRHHPQQAEQPLRHEPPFGNKYEHYVPPGGRLRRQRRRPSEESTIPWRSLLLGLATVASVIYFSPLQLKDIRHAAERVESTASRAIPTSFSDIRREFSSIKHRVMENLPSVSLPHLPSSGDALQVFPSSRHQQLVDTIGNALGRYGTPATDVIQALGSPDETASHSLVTMPGPIIEGEATLKAQAEPDGDYYMLYHWSGHGNYLWFKVNARNEKVIGHGWHSEHHHK